LVLEHLERRWWFKIVTSSFSMMMAAAVLGGRDEEDWRVVSDGFLFPGKEAHVEVYE
jgi:hypothetical protein